MFSVFLEFLLLIWVLGMSEGIKDLELVVLVDNNRNPRLDLAIGWGLSIYVMADNLKILFDTGPDPGLLEKNSRDLAIDIGDIDICVISHMHRDHLGGIEHIAKRSKRRIPLYLPVNSSNKVVFESMNFDVCIERRPKWIQQHVGLSGVFSKNIPEQALILDVKEFGALLLVGCSHSGIDNIVARIEKEMNVEISGIIGGWHLDADPRKILEVVKTIMDYEPKLLVPIHCSGEKVRYILKKKYPNIFLEGYVGLKIKIINGELNIIN